VEKARQAKIIGKSLEAKVVLRGPAELLQPAVKYGDVLREILNVSQLVMDPGGDGKVLSASVVKADGQKCERCWHWETDVGSHADHSTICGRCVEAVAQAAPAA
jgi:isoleucyl-tRNA synthetase